VGLVAMTLVLLVVLTGTATLTGQPLLIAVGVVVAGLILLVTRGREIIVRRRRRAAQPVPAGAAGPAPVLDVVPEDELTAVPLDGRTAAAVALGAAGLFMFNLVLGPLAIALGTAALRRGAPGRWGRPAAVAAILLGAVDLLVLTVLLIAHLSDGGFRWGS
jgi:hypothetical protein